MKKFTYLLPTFLYVFVIISCNKLEENPSELRADPISKVIPNVQNCGTGTHWDDYLGKCVPNCPIGYHNDSTTGACKVNGSPTISVITNPNNPYDNNGLLHNNGVSYVTSHVNPNSQTLTADILHYTKVYGSTVGLDTTGFDSWYSYSVSHSYFSLNDTTYIANPNSLNTKLYNDGRISSASMNYLNSLNNAISSVINDNSSPSSSLYSKIANSLITIETTIKNDGTLTGNERAGLLRVAAISRYTGAYWANYINGNGGGGPQNTLNTVRPYLFKNFSWARFWHADAIGAIGGAAGGAVGGWGGAGIGAILGAIGGSAGYSFFGD